MCCHIFVKLQNISFHYNPFPVLEFLNTDRQAGMQVDMGKLRGVFLQLFLVKA
jgi:hypothetical protein